ncbi:hypothetical protein LMG9673_04707 [Ralstonia pseudosolanacearum]|nr:hypothetical protein LMG9673_04707 [Ralstonia pseudosolanacearum]
MACRRQQPSARLAPAWGSPRLGWVCRSLGSQRGMTPTSCLQLSFRDAPPGATAIRAALEAAQGVLDRSGVSPRVAFKAYQAFAAGEGGPDSLALAFARAEAEAMDTLAAYGYVRYGSVSLAAL